jgi:predicted N-acyltransferase
VTAYLKDKMVAFAPCFYDLPDSYFWFGPAVLPFMGNILNLRSKIHLGQNHVLLCYSPFCYRTKVLLGKDINKASVIRKLSEEIDTVCRKEKILFSSFLFVSEYDKDLLINLENSGYHKSLWRPTLYLDVRWQNFEAYLNSLKHDFRQKVKHEIRKCNENGINIEKLSEFKDLATTLSDLSLNLFTKYNNRKRIFTHAFYQYLSDYAKANTIVFVAKKKDNIVGFSICLRKGETLDVFHCGFNYELQNKTDFTYFNLCYYTPIKFAIQEGIKKIYYRIAAERVKYKRGCKPELQYTLVKCHNRLLNSQINNYMKFKNKRAKTS